MSPDRIVVMQLINRFYAGGAELLACEIARRLPVTRYECDVCSILQTASEDGDFIQQGLAARGVKVHGMGKQRGAKSPATVLALRRLIKSRRVDILHTHCVSPDIYGALAVHGRKRPIIVRTLHSTGYTGELIQAVAGRLLQSRFAVSAVVSEGVKAWALRLGLQPDSLSLIHNGIDVACFTSAAPLDRASLIPGLPENCPLIISVGWIVTR